MFAWMEQLTESSALSKKSSTSQFCCIICFKISFSTAEHFHKQAAERTQAVRCTNADKIWPTYLRFPLPSCDWATTPVKSPHTLIPQ